MRKGRLAYVLLGILGGTVAILLALSLACGAGATATPAPAATPAPPVAPTPAPAPEATPIPTPPPVAVEKPQYGGNLRWGGLTDVKNLDPVRLSNWPEVPPAYALYNTLVSFAPDLSLQPELAKSWTVSSDGKTWTFRLQENVRFHDGTDFNAEAVKWNIKRVLDPNSFAKSRTVLEPFIASLDIPDKNTIVVRLTSPFRPLLATFAQHFQALGVASPAAVAKYGDKFGSNPVGTGPFKFKEWSFNERLILVRNENYWEPGKPYLDQLTMINVPDPTVAVAMLRTGELDINDVPPRLVSVAKANLNLKLVDVKTCNVTTYNLRQDRPPWNNKTLRQALLYATDRQKILDAAREGYGRVVHTPEGDCTWWSHTELEQKKIYAYDLAKAKVKLAEAGYPKGVDVAFMASATTTDLERSEILQAILAEAGIRLKIWTVPAADNWRHWAEKEDVDFGLNTSYLRPDPHIRIQVLWQTKGQFNVVKYSNPEVDRLINEAAAVYDQAKAKKRYDRLQEILWDDIPGWVSLYFNNDFVGMNKKVRNYVYYAEPYVHLQYLWLEK